MPHYSAIRWFVRLLIGAALVLAVFGVCHAAEMLPPRVISAATRYYTDDPAIWINPTDPAKSLVVGTDKNKDGALYVYDLDGKIVKVVDGLKRPNNVDIATGLLLGGKPVDIAVTTEREMHRLRVYT